MSDRAAPSIPRQPLPIDEVIDDVTGSLRRSPNLVLIAPPGSGKTTRVPPALLDAGLAGDGDIAVLQPRRLAARMAAQRVAAERGEAVGHTIGYEVRFDRKRSRATRIRYVTEGVLTRQLIADGRDPATEAGAPAIAHTRIVVIDEFHERHLDGDLALALLRSLQQTTRPDLILVVMSATLDPAPVSRFLGDCPVIESSGRTFPVTIEHDKLRDDRPLERRVASAVRRAVTAGSSGDVLVFLPGAAEIRRAMDACAELAGQRDLLLAPLHGDLPAAEQDRAVAPAGRRKVILSTNVAETSITIDGVEVVIDSGLARIARHSPWSGIPALRVEPISQASAAQRAGRAGRTRPGHCIRLYDQHDHDTRRPFDAPEIARADLAGAALLLHAWGVRRLERFAWYEPPPAAALECAETLLARLGAIEPGGAITSLGRRMLTLPVHPRQARLILEAERRGLAADGCMIAALLGHRELRLSRRLGSAGAAVVSGPSDLLEDLDHLHRARERGTRTDLARAGLDPGVARSVWRQTRQLVQRIGRSAANPPPDDDAADQALQIAILTGYPDLVARRRHPGSADLVLCGGGSAELSPDSVVTAAEFMVAVDVQERGRGGARSAKVRRASAVEPAWLLDLYIDRVRDSDEIRFNPGRERVERVRRMYYDELVIDEDRDPTPARSDPDRVARVLADAALSAGIDRFVDRQALDRFRARLAFVATTAPESGIAAPTDDDIRAALCDACTGLTSFAELERVSVLDILRARLSHEHRQVIDRLAPAAIRLPGRKRVPVNYEHDRPPWIASRLQDFFGLDTGPSVAGGRVPLVLHLLAPNRRAVQVTSDLAGFWTRHYPAVRKQLMRRYPRHAWPEDPRAIH